MTYGRDEAMLGGLALGAKASIGNAFCFVAGVYHRLRAAFFKGDLVEARAQQAIANSVVNLMNANAFAAAGGLVVSRHIMERKGVRLGPPRQPLRYKHAAAVISFPTVAIGSNDNAEEHSFPHVPS